MRFKLLMAFLCLNFALLAQESATRVAFDFGSGAVKMQMAVVDLKESRIVGKPLLSKYIPLGLIEDVAAHDGYISKEMEERALSILHRFKEEAFMLAIRERHAPLQFAGVATAVFRKAKNGRELLQKFEDQLGLRFQILSQDEEGKLGFLTAKALYPEIPESALLAWDSGNGSFQMTLKEGEEYKIYQGPFGHGNVRVILSKEIRKGPILKAHESGNPVSREEATELMQKIDESLPPTPPWLREALESQKMMIVTFGDGESIFALVAQALANFEGIREPIQESVIFYSDIQRVIDTYLGKGDEVFDHAGLHRKTLTSALHLSAVMKHFGIKKVNYKRSLGNTPGMLIAPQLWESTYHQKREV